MSSQTLGLSNFGTASKTKYRYGLSLKMARISLEKTAPLGQYFSMLNL
jgi:hypothetical protein